MEDDDVGDGDGDGDGGVSPMDSHHKGGRGRARIGTWRLGIGSPLNESAQPDFLSFDGFGSVGIAIRKKEREVKGGENVMMRCYSQKQTGRVMIDVFWFLYWGGPPVFSSLSF